MKVWLKLPALLALVVAVMALTASPAAAAPAEERRLSAARSLEAALLGEVNAVRRARGLAALRLSPQLAAAAAAHSRAMATRGFFSHTSADGTSFSQRVKAFYRPAGYRYWSAGENLLWAAGGLEASRALRMWMRSPAHRQNLLSPRWREVGLSAVQADAAPGPFGGRTVVIVTADFGVRR